MRFWLFTALLFVAVPQTTQPDVVFEHLCKVERFAFGPTGFVGVISVAEKNLQNGTESQSRFGGF